MFIKDAFDDGVVFFLCVCKNNNVIDVNLYPTGLKFFCQDGLKQSLKVGRCYVLCYVMLCGIYLPSVIYNFVVIAQ